MLGGDVEDLSMLSMLLGDEVRTLRSLPNRPVGLVGVVKEVGALFLVVEFADGRQGYYRPYQLERVVQGG
jgi:hypothetical protein